MSSSVAEKTEEDLLTSRLNELALTRNDDQSSGGSTKLVLQKELDLLGFSIFECIEDLGYFGWNPPHDTKKAGYKAFSRMTSIEDLKVKEYLEVTNVTPPELTPLSCIRTPLSFLSVKEPHGVPNKFPHGNLEIIALHVAAQHKGVDLACDVDFCFGGSTLEMLATCNKAKDPYLVTLVPGTTNTLAVIKTKQYVRNSSDVGFQFERLMTGQAMDDRPAILSLVEHLHIMKVGNYKVLFRAETDARHQGLPVEIKSSNPRNWGSKVMFQMISSGSTQLCHGKKGRGQLLSVELKSLQQVSKTSKIETFERCLERNMKSLMDQMQEASAGDVFKISFLKDISSSTPSLHLTLARGRSADVFPNECISKAMLSPP